MYQPEELTKARSSQKRILTAMSIVAGLGFVSCVLICCFTTRQNIRLTLPMIVGSSTLSGWIVIFLSHSRYEGAKALARHLDLMLTGPREQFSGRFHKLNGVYQVKKGVAIRKIRLQEDYHETMLTVYNGKASVLPDEFIGTAETVYDCIVAFETASAFQEVRR